MIDMGLVLFLRNFKEYIDPKEIKNTITRKVGKTDNEFRNRIKGEKIWEKIT